MHVEGRGRCRCCLSLDVALMSLRVSRSRAGQIVLCVNLSCASLDVALMLLRVSGRDRADRPVCDVASCERWAVSRADRPVCDVRASCKRWAVSRACWNSPEWIHQDSPITATADRPKQLTTRTYVTHTEPPILSQSRHIRAPEPSAFRHNSTSDTSIT